MVKRAAAGLLAAWLGPCLTLGGSVPHQEPGQTDLPHLHREHWGLGSSVSSRVVPVGLFECKLSGTCSAEEERDTLRLLHAAEALSTFDLVATLCQDGDLPFLPPDAPICTDPQHVLGELGLLEPVIFEVLLGEGHGIGSLTADPSAALTPGLMQQCVAASVPLDMCMSAIEALSHARLCGLQPLLSPSPPHDDADKGRLAAALRHVCSPPPSQAPLPSGIRLSVGSPRDGARVMGLSAPVTLSVLHISPSIDSAMCEVCAAVEGADAWCVDLRRVARVGGPIRAHVGEGEGQEEGEEEEGEEEKLWAVDGPLVLPLSGSGHPSWRCAQEAKGKDKDKGYGPQVCIDRFAHPGLRRVEVQARCLPRLRQSSSSASNTTRPTSLHASLDGGWMVLWRYVANLYNSPTPVNSSVAPALSLTLHCNTTTTPPHKTRFYSRKTSTLSGGPATTITPIKVQEWGEHLLSEEGRAGRASELCAQCPGAGAQCETLVATVLHEQVRETYYSEVWGLNRHLIESKVDYQDLEGSVLWFPIKVQALIDAAISKGPGTNSTVCEIGFNAGHSALVWLLFRPQVRLLAFDLLEHHYASLAVNYLLKRFPNRIVLVTGDSTLTVPAFVAAHPDEKCDMLFIDGGHSYEVAKADIENFKPLAKNDSLVIMDDAESSEVKRAWSETMDAGLIAEEGQDLESRSCEGLVEDVVNGVLQRWNHVNSFLRASISTGRYVI